MGVVDMKRKYNPMYQLLDGYIKPHEKNTLSLATLDILSKSAESFEIIRQPNFSVFSFKYSNKKELYIHLEENLSFVYVYDEHKISLYHKSINTEREIIEIAKEHIDVKTRSTLSNFRVHDAMGFYSNLLAILHISSDDGEQHYNIYPEDRDNPSYTIIIDPKLKLSKDIYMVYKKPSQNDYPDFDMFTARSRENYYNTLDCKELMFLNREDLIELMKNNY